MKSDVYYNWYYFIDACRPMTLFRPMLMRPSSFRKGGVLKCAIAARHRKCPCHFVFDKANSSYDVAAYIKANNHVIDINKMGEATLIEICFSF